ncbi:MAG: methylmalonyl Co-A mutase-associated GTPase MeaB [Rhodocyclaceae bacterium]|nr:methylmalonyl Co-A mutase-associated GTPase MeaB [Rhodocyclaceae bacterium]
MTRIDPGSAEAVAVLVSRLLSGETRALAKAITKVECGEAGAAALLAAIQPHLGHATVLGITGPPGVGKSTLIDALIAELRCRGKRVGVLAVDPSSPVSGGAILGDRVRMARHTGDAGVFVRSLASRGHLGGLFRTAWGVIQVMDAAGPDYILLETVGTGQSEVEICDYAHANLVLCAPGLGDDIQAIKSGILEIADILVVNKADQPNAATTVSQLQGMLGLRSAAASGVSVVTTTASTGEGLPALADLIEAIARDRTTPAGRRRGSRGARRALANAAGDRVRERALQAEDSSPIDALCERFARGEIALDAAAAELVRLVADGEDGGE